MAFSLAITVIWPVTALLAYHLRVSGSPPPYVAVHSLELFAAVIAKHYHY